MQTLLVGTLALINISFNVSPTPLLFTHKIYLHAVFTLYNNYYYITCYLHRHHINIVAHYIIFYYYYYCY